MAKPKNKPNAIANLPTVAIGSIAVAKLFSVSMLIVGIVVIGTLFYQVMASFFVPLFLAALLVVIFRPVHARILERVKGRQRIASILTTTFILLLVLLPAGLILSVAAAQGTSFFRRLSAGGVTESLERIRKGLSLDMPSADSFRKLDQDIDELAQPLPIDATKLRIEQVEGIVHKLQAEFAGEVSADGSDQRLIDDLALLSDRALAVAEMDVADDLMARESTQQAYQTQYTQLKRTSSDWTHSILGNSIMTQLKLASNPTAAEVQAMIQGTHDYLQPRVLPLTQVASQFLFQTLVAFGILVVSLYFFFADGTSMVQTMMRLSPLDDEYEKKLLLQFDQTSRAVVLATVLSALAQGILAAIAYWFLGLPSVILLFIATTFMGLVPFMGAASVWIPCVIYLGAVEHRIEAAIGLALYGAAVISSIDNVIKIYVLQGHSQIHPLLALLSVLGGMQVFGPVGILVGPMVVVFLQTLLEILNHELEGRASGEAPVT